jgi:hypothetical protein
MHAKARRIFLALIVCALVALGAAAPLAHAIEGADDDDLIGLDLGSRQPALPTVQAAFRSESYRAGDIARLRQWSKAKHVTVQIFRAAQRGAERRRPRATTT